MRKASIFTIFLIVFVDLVGFGIVLPNLQLYGQRIGINNYFFLTLIGATYSLFQFGFAPILGKWSDHIGRRPVLIISQCGTVFGFLLLFAADFANTMALGVTLIFASRIIDGISGGNISTANAYIADITTPENRSKGMGAIGAAFGLGFVFGPVIGGTVAHFLGLGYVPIVAAAFSLTALLMTIFTLPESRKFDGDNPAAARRFTVRTIEHALMRPIIGPMILLFFLNGFAFAGMEQTFSLLIQHRLYPLPPTAVVKASFNSHTVSLSLPGAAKERRRQDDRASTASGYLFGCIGIVIVLIQGGMIGRLTKKYGETALAIVGPMIIAAGLVLIGIPVHWAWRWTGFLAGGILLAIGSGLFNPSMQSLISRHCSAGEQGEVLGATQGMASLARALGPVVAGVLFEYAFPAMPYYVSAAVCVLVTLVVFSGRAKYRPPVAPPVTVTAEAAAVSQASE
ncbi:MAG: MFS transporter [Phycisphaerae bacterium]